MIFKKSSENHSGNSMGYYKASHDVAKLIYIVSYVYLILLGQWGVRAVPVIEFQKIIKP